MSIEVVIKQKGFFKKECPTEIILGNDLSYGTYEAGYRLCPGVMGKSEFIAYNKSRMGRGISVEWLSRNRKAVFLRALTPISEEELRDFYSMVSRIANYWNCTLEVDGNKMSLKEFNDGFDSMLDFNNRMLTRFASDILEEQTHKILFSAMYPLSFGVKEAESVLADPQFFGRWLSEKQTEDFYYALSQYYATPQGIQGMYVLTENCSSIFPLKPYVPYGIIDPSTKEQLTCSSYEIRFFSACIGVLGTIPYDKFIENLDQELVSYFDADHILVKPFSADDMRKFLEKINTME